MAFYILLDELTMIEKIIENKQSGFTFEKLAVDVKRIMVWILSGTPEFRKNFNKLMG